MHILMELGCQVSIPCDPHCVYDCIVDNGTKLLRLQVKSCNTHKRNRYRVDIAQGAENNKHAYKENSFDLFVIYIPDESAWYIIPLQEVMGQRWLSVRPHNNCGKYEKYRSCWSSILVG
jgi:hypothetical protein